MDIRDMKIIAFACTYCAYNAADLAGSMRIQYPTNVRIVKLLCTGKVEPVFLLEAFRYGADAVFVAGCMEGECHFLRGNLRARQIVEYTKGLLHDAGIDPARLEMFNMSASMAQKFVEAVNTMVDRLKELGPSPLRGFALDRATEISDQAPR
ncbi:MAG: hydrogenase iron-sulfur subunit [Deltaproteobacteria bacterium]|nr:hydrogenase iron-sulfur subunit [Deltaproteobacteria bacterium]